MAVIEKRVDLTVEQILQVLGITKDEWDQIRQLRAKGLLGRDILHPRPLVDALDEYVASRAYVGLGHAVNTQEQYASALRQWREFIVAHWGDATTDSLSPEMVQMFLNQRGSSSTHNQSLVVLRYFFDWCVARRYCSQNPARNRVIRYRKQERLQRPSVLTTEQAARVLEFAKQTRYAVRNYTLMLTLMTTGARLQEVVDLKETDVDFRSRKVRLVGKGGKERYVDLIEPLPAVLQGYLDHIRSMRHVWQVNPEHAHLLFYSQHGSQRGKPISRRSVQDLVNRLVAHLGLPYRPDHARITVHALRHFYAVQLWLQDVPLPRIQRLLGHSSVETTMVYLAALADEDLGRKMELAFPLTEELRREIARVKQGGYTVLEEVDES